MKGQRFGLFAAVLVASPVIAGIVYSVLGAIGIAGSGRDGPSLDHVSNVIADGATWTGLMWTLWVAFASTALALVLAIVVAMVLRGDRRIDRLARTFAIVPLPFPHVVAALCAVLFLSQSGMLSRLAYSAGIYASPGDMPALVYDRWGIGLIIALTWKEFSFLVFIAFSVLARRGAILEETARSLGAGTIRTFRVATLPALWRGLLPSAIAVFTFVAGNYEATVLLAPSSPLALPLLTMESHTDPSLERRGEAYVLVLIAAIVSVCAVVVHEWVANRVEVVE
ncbi:MAG: ABC transporter permease subunit [Gemmatimonadaceae bacterium]|nr:ABC transporter permease subunit [Gemmatimonadaceae bacterium]